MKETDIVQALRCCAEGECKDCAMHEDKQRCQENLLDKAAEAIERLTAENADLLERRNVMERLTKWENGNAYYPRCFKDPCYGDGCKIKDCPFEEAVCERLAAYEDTGLTPEEIKAPFTEDTMINLAAQALGVEPSRLREIAEADKDGRCVVLPCKVGDTVWSIVRDGEPHITRDEVRDMYFADDMTLCVELVGGRVTFTEKFGKTVFLSREEAEKALREMEGKKDG